MIIFVETNAMNRSLQSILTVVFIQLFFSGNLIAQIPSYVPTNGLVGYWPFSGNANDVSGNDNDGVVFGAIATEDRFGQANSAYYFDGVNDYGYVNPETGNFGTSDFTISTWVFDANENNTGSIVAKRISSSFGNFFSMDWEDGPQIQINESNASDYYLYTSSFSFNDSWSHYVLVRQGSVIKMFINGTLLHELDTEFTHSIDNSANLSFGARSYSNTYVDYLNAAIDDVAMWDRALTTNEIFNIYAGCAPLSTLIIGNPIPLNFTAAEYTCNDNPSSTFNWTVTNGVISSGQGTNSIVVLWGNEGVGTVSVVETNSEGCTGQPAVIEVNISCTSNISQISGNSQPIILQAQTYTVNGPVDSQYEWTVTNGVIASGQGTNSVNVIWAAEGEGVLTVVETTATGCESSAVTFTANAVITNISELSKNHFILYPNPSSDRITIECDAILVGEAYQIFDALGQLQQEGLFTNQKNTITLNHLAAGNYFLKVGSEVLRVCVGG